MWAIGNKGNFKLSFDWSAQESQPLFKVNRCERFFELNVEVDHFKLEIERFMMFCIHIRIISKSFAALGKSSPFFGKTAIIKTDFHCYPSIMIK
jgi:hypothetical protein